MTAAGSRHVDCSNPIEAAVLMDYWLAILPSDDEEAVEAHLLACDGCGDRLRDTITLADGLKTLARSGALHVVVSDEYLQRAASAGQRVREYAARPGASIQCTVTLDDDLLVARLVADLSNAARVDLSWCDAQGVELIRMADIPIRTDAGTVLCQQSIVMAKASASGAMIARLFAVDSDARERLLGEYVFRHTRTIPGPGTWPF